MEGTGPAHEVTAFQFASLHATSGHGGRRASSMDRDSAGRTPTRPLAQSKERIEWPGPAITAAAAALVAATSGVSAAYSFDVGGSQPGQCRDSFARFLRHAGSSEETWHGSQRGSASEEVNEDDEDPTATATEHGKVAHSFGQGRVVLQGRQAR